MRRPLMAADMCSSRTSRAFRNVFVAAQPFVPLPRRNARASGMQLCQLAGNESDVSHVDPMVALYCVGMLHDPNG
jgi:hypothetical protein